MPARPLHALTGPVIGLLSAGTAVGVGEAVAVFVRPAAAPVIAVGNKLILLTPSSVERTATQTVGTSDKPDLIIGIYLVLAIFGAFIGNLAIQRLRYGLIGVGVFAAFGVYCAATAHASRATDVIPTLVGAAAAAAVMILLVRLAGGDDRAAGTTGSVPRRSFLQAGTTIAAVAAVLGFGGRALQHARFDVNRERATEALPKPPPTAEERVPAGVDLRKSGVPWATPNSQFYRVDTALDVPEVSRDNWSLHIHGMVDREITLSWNELVHRPLIERWITLNCVSNPVGGPLIGNAKWLGTRLADVLREAGIQDQSDELLLTSIDGMTIGAPTKVVLDGRDALLAIGMNGVPLPIEHGYPVRTIVPGLYGYVSACKWIVDIEATTFAAKQAYWVDEGWAQAPDLKLESRIDTPHSGAKLTVGRPVPVAGVAWDQHVGVSKVEIQVGDGPWQIARLATVPSTDTWRQWVVSWTPPKPGSYLIRVRAFDGHGTPQTMHAAAPYPSGATGLHTITVQAG